MRFVVVSLALAAAAVIASCQSTKSAEAAPAPAESAPAEAAAPAEPRPWANGQAVKFDELPDNLKGPYMKEVVLPTMKKVFQDHDAEEFKDFDCKTCHGENAKQRAFEMPSPEIHVLDLEKDKVEHPDDVKWMSEVVKPTMAKLLGEPEWDAQSAPKGFGCTGCHTMKQ